jgi:hypothetical protein
MKAILFAAVFIAFNCVVAAFLVLISDGFPFKTAVILGLADIDMIGVSAFVLKNYIR